MSRLTLSRPLDHIYDPVYTTNAPGNRNRPQAASAVGARASASGAAGGPAHDRRVEPSGEDLGAEVAGAHRFKYFKRPVVPSMQTVPPEVLLAPTAADEARNPLVAPPGASARVSEEGGTRAVAVQTQYRESEAQTLPYTPDYTVPEGGEPEVLALATLKAEQGLPAGLAEVEMIERARQKRAFEAALPPMTDEASFALRKRLMEEQETREWAARESEIDKLQNERLRLLRDALAERDRENEFLGEERVEVMRQQRLQSKERAVIAIQRRRVQALRKMMQTRQQEEAKLKGASFGAALGTSRRSGGGQRRDIIAEYADPCSSVYAPKTRLGAQPASTEHHVDVQPQDLRTLGGLAELEHQLPPSATGLVVRRPPRDGRAGRRRGRSDAQVESHLERVRESLARKTSGEAEPKRSLPAWRKTPERVHRPATPRAAAPPGEEETDLALVLLQRLLRGRAVQDIMFEGKERRMALIRELRASEPLEAEAEDLARTDADAEAQRSQEEAANAAVDAAQGEVVSHTLAYLANERVRLREQRRVLDLARHAERERRTREAEEGGRRAAEVALRTRGDELFKQLLGAHQRTVDSFLEDVTARAVAATARTRAEDEASVQDASVEGAVAHAEAEAGRGGQAAVVRDLVAAFIVPEVERQRVQREVEIEERRFVSAAHSAIYESVVQSSAAVSEGKEEEEDEEGAAAAAAAAQAEEKEEGQGEAAPAPAETKEEEEEEKEEKEGESGPQEEGKEERQSAPAGAEAEDEADEPAPAGATGEGEGAAAAQEEAKEGGKDDVPVPAEAADGSA